MDNIEEIKILLRKQNMKQVREEVNDVWVEKKIKTYINKYSFF